MWTKEEFHKFIDDIEDDKLLKGYLELVKNLRSNQTGSLWNELSEEGKEELLWAYDKSFDRKNLVSHSSMKERHAKWLDQ